METKSNGDVTKVDDNGSAENKNVTGWIFIFINDGWLKKGWKKRWCIIKDEQMHLYESETPKDSSKPSGILDLKNYNKCVEATKKESKKSSHTLALELPKAGDSKEKTTQKGKSPAKKANRELFYTSNEEEKDRWIEKINEAITMARMGNSKSLEHVTKSRAKPAAVKRRPPTRKHIREVASQSQLLPGIDLEEASRTEPVKRGHVPSAAIKPKPPGGVRRPASVQVGTSLPDMNLDRLPSPDEDSSVKTPIPFPRQKALSVEEEDNHEETPSSPSKEEPSAVFDKPPLPSQSKAPLVPPNKPSISSPNKPPLIPPNKPSPKDSPAKTSGPPPTPDKALKPKLILNVDLEEEVEEETYFEEEVQMPTLHEEAEKEEYDDEERSYTSSPMQPYIEKLRSTTEVKGPILAPRSTKSLDRRDFDHAKVRSAPSSLMIKPKNASEAKAMLLKTQALQEKLKLPGPGETSLSSRKGLSQSLCFLDAIDDDLPPPPEPPPLESISDVEIKFDNQLEESRKKKMKKRKVSKAKSFDNSIDKD